MALNGNDLVIEPNISQIWLRVNLALSRALNKNEFKCKYRVKTVINA
jgi:hypothetical protein